MINIGVFVYGKTSTNIGDPVQSLVNANAWAKTLHPDEFTIEYETKRLQVLFERCNPLLVKALKSKNTRPYLLKKAAIKIRSNEVIEIKKANDVVEMNEAKKVVEIKKANDVVEINQANEVVEINQANEVVEIKEANKIVEIQEANDGVETNEANKVIMLNEHNEGIESNKKRENVTSVNSPIYDGVICDVANTCANVVDATAGTALPNNVVLSSVCTARGKQSSVVEKKAVKVWEIERDHMSEITSKIPVRESIHVIMNGWFMHPMPNSRYLDWPPPPCVVPIFVSFHAHDNLLFSTRGVQYFKAHEPIGCRDHHTVHLMRKRGIAAWWSGCLTLTMDDVVTAKKRKSGAFIVDTRAVSVVKKIIGPEKVHYVNHTSNLRALADPFDVAFRLMQTYASASYIFTSRLHCLLPSAAMGARVRLVNKTGQFEDRKLLKGERFNGLADLALPENKQRRLGVRNKLQVYVRKRVVDVWKGVRRNLPVVPVTVEIFPTHIDVFRRAHGSAKLQLANTPMIDWNNVRRFLSCAVIPLMVVNSDTPDVVAVKAMFQSAAPQFVRYSRSSEIVAYKPAKTATTVTPKKRIYPLVFTCDANYIQHVATVLNSIQKSHWHLRSKIEFKVYLLIRDISLNSPSVQSLRTTVFTYLSMFDLYVIESRTKFQYRNNLPHVSMSCLDRLLIPTLLKEKVVLYMDLDILCFGDITPIFNKKISKKGIIAKKSVKNNVISNWLQKIDQNTLKYTHETSVNAGILLMNLDILRKTSFSHRTISICEKHGVNDQIAINIYLDGLGHSLDAKYNAYFNQDFRNMHDTAVIVHFSGAIKPWHSNFDNKKYANIWKDMMLPPARIF